MSDKGTASWSVRCDCSRAEGEAIGHGDLDSYPWAQQPVIVSQEIAADRPDDWQITAYFPAKPAQADLTTLARMIGDRRPADLVVEKLPDDDWVSLSQSGLEPIRAGRFHVHTPDYPPCSDDGVHNIQISAGLAFGTGHHETTAGCLTMLDHIRRSGARADTILDLGSGTGLLAFAAHHLWPRAYVTASDIDPVCADVMAENIVVNGLTAGMRQGAIAAIIADGMDDPMLEARAPYQLIAANILAGPLIEMAADIADALAPQGNLVLAGLLNQQADDVIRAYRYQGLRLAHRIISGDWSILWLRKRPVA